MLLLLACTAQDAWTPTRAACGLSPDDSVTLRDTWPTADTRHQLDIDVACAEALLADVHADPERLLVELGFAGDLEAHLAASANLNTPSDAVHGLVEGLYWLLASSIDDAEPDAWIASSWIDTMDADQDRSPTAAQARYNYVVDGIRRVSVDPEGYTAMDPDGTLWVANYLASGAPPVAAAILVHEARHADGAEQNHVPCPDDPIDGPYSCDLDLEGAVGWGVTALTLDLRADPAFDNACGGADAATESVRDHLLAWRALWAEDLTLGDTPLPERDACP